MIQRIALLAVTLVAASAWAPAAAHEGPGTIEVLSAEPTSAEARTYRLRVVFAADGHAAPEATVTAIVVDQPGAVPVSFVPTGEEGVYEGTVRFPGPGEWTVRLTSLRPIGSVERTETIAPPVAEATPTTAPSPPDTEQATPAADERTDGAGAMTTVAMVVVGATVLAVGGAVMATRRRRTVTRRDR